MGSKHHSGNLLPNRPRSGKKWQRSSPGSRGILSSTTAGSSSPTRASRRSITAVTRAPPARRRSMGAYTGDFDDRAMPVRDDWASRYCAPRRRPGAHAVAAAEWLNNTICIDTGCVYGDRLTALRWPKRGSCRCQRWRAMPARPAGRCRRAGSHRAPSPAPHHRSRRQPTRWPHSASRRSPRWPASEAPSRRIPRARPVGDPSPTDDVSVRSGAARRRPGASPRRASPTTPRPGCGR